MFEFKSSGKLRTKLLVIFLSAGISLLLVTIFVSVWLFQISLDEVRKNVKDSLKSTSYVVADHVSSQLFFNMDQQQLAKEDKLVELPVVKDRETISALLVFDRESNIVGEHYDVDEYKNYLLSDRRDVSAYVVEEKKVFVRGNYVGVVRLMSDQTPHINNMLAKIVTMFLLLAFIYIAIASLLYYLVTNIHRRFDSLLAVTKHVHDNRQLNLRVSVEGNDEVTDYSNYFNAMLDVIEVQTCKLETFNLQLSHQILHDKLCDLPNREYLRLHIRSLIKKYHQQLGGFSIMELDIDHFKKINDQYGHHAGDDALRLLSDMIRELPVTDKFAARLGGDEFVIVIDGDENGEIIQDVYHKLKEKLSSKEVCDHHAFAMELSAGVSLCPLHGKNIIQLLKASDAALYKAKASGKNCVRVYDESLKVLSSNSKGDQNALAEVDLKYVEPIFQPIYSQDGLLFGIECLATYQPSNTVIRADKFIELLEEQGLIAELDLAMLEKSLQYASQLGVQTANESLKIFHNFSVDTLSKPGFVEELKSILKVYEIKSSSLVMEVTESLQLNQQAIDNLNALSKSGIVLCIDDFGAGFTNPVYFRDVKWDYIKIDKKYINDLDSDNHTLQLIDSLFALSRLLNIEVVAEGVEKTSSINILNRYGCRYFQGYYFGTPWTFNELKINYTKSIGPSVFQC